MCVTVDVKDKIIFNHRPKICMKNLLFFIFFKRLFCYTHVVYWKFLFIRIVVGHKYEWNRQDRRAARKDVPLAKVCETEEEERKQKEAMERLQRNRELYVLCVLCTLLVHKFEAWETSPWADHVDLPIIPINLRIRKLSKHNHVRIVRWTSLGRVSSLQFLF